MRAVIDTVVPVVDGGRFRAKCIAGEAVHIEAHCFTDGHDKLGVVLRWHALDEPDTYEVDMTAQVNDVWTAQFTPPVPGRYRYTRDWPGSITSNRGAGNWSGAMILPIFGSRSTSAPT